MSVKKPEPSYIKKAERFIDVLEQRGYLSDKAKSVNKKNLIEVTAQLFQIYCEYGEKSAVAYERLSIELKNA